TTTISEVHDEKGSIQETYFDLVPLLLVPRVLCDGEEAKEPKAEPVEDIAYNISKPMEFARIAEHCDDLHAFKEQRILWEATKDGAEDSVAGTMASGRWRLLPRSACVEAWDRCSRPWHATMPSLPSWTSPSI
ncbi:unnamed protein product, partial [Ixodes persulcatus]